MTILTVRHLTTYSYAVPVRLGEHRMMLRPRDSNDQRLLKSSLEIEPRPQRVRWIHDVFDNCVAIADFSGETRRLEVENTVTLEHIAPDEPDFLLEDRARYYPFSYDAEEMPDLARAIARHYPDQAPRGAERVFAPKSSAPRRPGRPPASIATKRIIVSLRPSPGCRSASSLLSQLRSTQMK